MRKTTIATFAAIVLLGVGGALFIMNPFDPAAAITQDLSERFMEDVQFKDFRQSSLYHHKLERDRVDVGQSIELLFQIKPELLDLMQYRIIKAEVDSTGDRARVKVRTRYEILNTGEGPKDGELILYWIKRNPDCPMGASCQSGVCVDEFGKKLLKPDEDKRAQERRRTYDENDPKLTDEPFKCDVAAEDKWFMNLDSTFKTKKYNY